MSIEVHPFIFRSLNCFFIHIKPSKREEWHCEEKGYELRWGHKKSKYGKDDAEKILILRVRQLFTLTRVFRTADFCHSQASTQIVQCLQTTCLSPHVRFIYRCWNEICVVFEVYRMTRECNYPITSLAIISSIPNVSFNKFQFRVNAFNLFAKIQGFMGR